MLDKQFDANMNLGTDDEGTHLQGVQSMQAQSAQGVHAKGAQGTHAKGAQSAHVQGAEGAHFRGAQGTKWQVDYGSNRRLTLPQKQVLEQLAIWLRGEEKTITFIYRRLGEALGMGKGAARVHVEALREKGLLLSTVVYCKNSKNRIGVRISITPDAPIKHLPHKLSETEKQELNERNRKDAQVRILLRQGYEYIAELDGYVRSPKNLNR